LGGPEPLSRFVAVFFVAAFFLLVAMFIHLFPTWLKKDPPGHARWAERTPAGPSLYYASCTLSPGCHTIVVVVARMPIFCT
jgi:hypothetical protein